MAELTVDVVCRCPEQPHDHDTITLRPQLDLATGIAIEAAITSSRTDGEFDERLFIATVLPVLVRYGAVAWSREIPFDVELILADYAVARPVGDAASDLYLPAVVDPLVARLSSISPPGPTNGSTSPRPASTRRRRARSSPGTSAATAPSMP